MTTDPLNIFGRLIEPRRRAFGLSQTELGAAVGMAQGDISKLERGKYGVNNQVGDQILRRMAETLDLPFKWLVLARSGIPPEEEGEYALIIGYGDDSELKGGHIVPAPKLLLGGRAPDQCFEIIVSKDQARKIGRESGEHLIFEKLSMDQEPEINDIVAFEHETGWELVVWSFDRRMHPAGRAFAYWGSINR